MPRLMLDNPTILYMRFNDWVRGELRRQNKSQTDLAKYLGIEQCGVSKRLGGKARWSLKEALETVDYLEGDLREIL